MTENKKLYQPEVCLVQQKQPPTGGLLLQDVDAQELQPFAHFGQFAAAQVAQPGGLSVFHIRMWKDSCFDWPPVKS